MRDTLEAVQSILVDHLGLDSPPVAGSMLEDLGADSLDHVEIAIAVEEEFGVELSDDEIDKIKTVQDILDVLHTKGVA